MLIGELLVTPVRPDDLDAQLVEATGCSAEEMKGLIVRGPVGFLAAALHPFINTSCDLSRGELASAIAEAGVEELRPLIVALYEGKDDVGNREPRKPSRSRRRK